MCICTKNYSNLCIWLLQWNPVIILWQHVLQFDFFRVCSRIIKQEYQMTTTEMSLQHWILGIIWYPFCTIHWSNNKLLRKTMKGHLIKYKLNSRDFYILWWELLNYYSGVHGYVHSIFLVLQTHTKSGEISNINFSWLRTVLRLLNELSTSDSILSS